MATLTHRKPSAPATLTAPAAPSESDVPDNGLERCRDRDTASIEPSARERLAAGERPRGWPAGYQNWHDLLFVHWRVPVEVLRPLVPPQLAIDTFDGDAWLGLVAFHMTGLRPVWFPAVPGVAAFHETNLRTYVHRDGHDPAVWFLSLDAQSRLAAEVARWKWHLNYFHADMRMDRGTERALYQSTRRDRRCRVPADVRIDARFPPDCADPDPSADAAPMRTPLEHFLVDRYFLFSSDSRGRLYRAQVHHRPYPLRPVELEFCEQSLSAAAGVPVDRAPDHVTFCPGVTVDIFPLRRVNP